MTKMRHVELEVQTINKRIADSWGENITTRAKDLEQETDRTYIDVIKPWVIKKIREEVCNNVSVLDIGCGCGYLTNAVCQEGVPRIKGVDISSKAIAYAKNRYPDIAFECCDICDYEPNTEYDICLGVMTLNNMTNIEDFFASLCQLLSKTGKALLVIPHPCFWPRRHLKDVGYNYFNEKAYEFTFATKGRADYCVPVLYFHRTMGTYCRCIEKMGFEIVDIQELSDENNAADPDILCIEICRK